MNIKKNDIVKVLAGKDRGKTGKVLNVNSKSRRVIIEGLNVYKKHMKPKKQGEKGEIVKLNRSIDISNAQVICPNCKQSTRVGFRTENDNKLRFCKKCQSQI